MLYIRASYNFPFKIKKIFLKPLYFHLYSYGIQWFLSRSFFTLFFIFMITVSLRNMRKFLSGALAGALVISQLAPLGNITFAYDPTPAFTTNVVQANVPASGPTTARGTNMISFNGQPNNGDTFTIGSTVYRFVSSL